MQFFIISTSKSGPNMWCLYILTSKCASRHNGVRFFIISTSKSGLRPSFFTLLTSKCASCHNGVQFFISYLPRWLRTRRFSKPTFRPSGVPKHWKNRVFCDFSTFLLSSDLFSPLIFYLLLFSSLALPTSAFLSVHIVGSLTSKLPSIIVTYHSYLSLLPIVVILPIFNHCFLS